MNLIFHIVRKDVLRLRAWVATWLAVLALPVVPSFFTEEFAHELNKIGVGGLQHVLQVLTAGIVVVLLVQGDSVLGTRAFWRTRPIGAGRLLVAKMVAALTILWGGWMLIGLPWWLWCGWGAGEITRAALEALVMALVITTPGFVLGALTDSVARAIIWSPIALVFLLWFLPAAAGVMGQFEAQRFFVRSAVAMIATSVIIWIALAGFYRGRWSRKSFWFWGVGAVVLWMLAATLPSDQLLRGHRAELRPELGRRVTVKYESASIDVTLNHKREQVHSRVAFSAQGVDELPYVLEGMGAMQRWCWSEFSYERDAFFNRIGHRRIPAGYSPLKKDPETTAHWQQKRDSAGRSLVPRVPPPTIENPQDPHFQAYQNLIDQKSIGHRLSQQPSTYNATLWFALLRDSVAAEVPLSAGSVGLGGDHRVDIRTVSSDAKGWHALVVDYTPQSWTREIRETLRKAEHSVIYRDEAEYVLLNRATKESVLAPLQHRPRVVYVHGVGVCRKQLSATVAPIVRNGAVVTRPEWQSGLSLAYVRWETVAIFKREVKAEGFLATAAQPLRIERDAGSKK